MKRRSALLAKHQRAAREAQYRKCRDEAFERVKR